MISIFRRALFAAFALHAGLAAALTLPSVPIGGRLLVVFSLSQAGLPPLANLDITMSVQPAGCGTFDGASTRQVTTNSSGVASFTMDAGNRVGQCTIVGTAQGTSASGSTWVYDPAKVTLELLRPIETVYVNSFPMIQVTVRADGHPLYGMFVTADPLPTSGPSAFIGTSPATNDLGLGHLSISTNSVPGVYDIVIHAAGQSAPVRIWQKVLPAAAPPAGRVYRTSHPDLGGITLSIVSGPSGCVIESASYYDDQSDADKPPVGTLGFVQGRFQFKLRGCQGTTQMSVEYPQALPADGQLFLGTNVHIPATVSGRTVTFGAVDNSSIDSERLAGGQVVTSGGVAKPGVFPTPRPHPDVNGMWWSGSIENGWGMSVAQATSPTNNLFAVIYAYDAQGKPTWWVMPGGSWDGAHLGFKSTVYWPYGTPYYAYRGGLTVVGDDVGKLTFQFPDGNSGRMDFTIAGVTASKLLQRQVFGLPGSVQRPDVGGLYFGGASESGWGVSIVQQQDTLFGVWYTYDETNHPTWFVMPGGQWTSSTTYEGRLYRTRGSPWLGRTYDASQLVVTDVGPYRFRFDGAKPTFEYQVDGVSGTLTLQRNTPF